MSGATWNQEAILVDLNTLVTELVLRLLDLAEEGLVRFRGVVKAKEAKTERGQGVGAEGDEKPPWDLMLAIAESLSQLENSIGASSAADIAPQTGGVEKGYSPPGGSGRQSPAR